MQPEYQPNSIEKNAQNYWQENQVFEVKEEPNLEKFYCLSMLPYPSGSLHIGHIRNYAIGDAIARFQKMLGKNVLQPMGWDAFGLPAENAAIERGMQASKWTRENIAEMKSQLIQMGFGFDWSRELATCDPSYYAHEQWFFTELVKRGLAYRKMATVNWDPVENTVLANEQVIDGKGYRSGAVVEKKQIEQWFIKSTEYLEPLLEGIKTKLSGWPNQVKTLQTEWIGKSQGLSLTFYLKHSHANLAKHLEVYTTRADTLMGASFMAISIDHPIAMMLNQSLPEIKAFIEQCKKLKEAQQENQEVEKIGFEIPIDLICAIHPITKKEIPIWIANYVLIEYGTGAIMAVPAHDQRDYDFAKQYGLDILPVIKNPNENRNENRNEKLADEIYTGYGEVYNSGLLNGLDFDQAVETVYQSLVKTNQAEKTTHFKMHDWGVSRQRYWGCPIPIIWDQNGEPQGVEKENLPVVLPEDVQFTGYQSPLGEIKEFVQVNQNNQKFKRETDTFDTFVESSWYFLRYCCPDAKEMVDQRVDYWMPVDQYVGGIEHATMHLIYARVWQRMMKTIGLVQDDEPFKKLLCQGMVVGPYFYRQVEKSGHWVEEYFSVDELDLIKDEQGTIVRAMSKKDAKEVLISDRNIKISKSKRNGKDPLEIAKNYSADTLRLFILFAAPADKALVWNESGLDGAFRFLKRLYRAVYQLNEQGLIKKNQSMDVNQFSKQAVDLYTKLQQTIQKAEMSMADNYQFNTAIAANMELLNQWMVFKANNPDEATLKVAVIESIVLMLSPITPHLCHQLWFDLGHQEPLLTKKAKRNWPLIDEKYLYANDVTLVIQINGKSRSKLEVNIDISDDEIRQQATSDPKVKKELVSGKLRKTIIVNQTKRKLVNFVIG